MSESPSGADPAPAPDDGQPPPDTTRLGWSGRAAQLTARGQALYAALEQSRPRHAPVEIGFRWVLRDKEIAGGVLGGGLAYRFFFWTLSWTVLTAGGLGFFSRDEVDSALEEAGLSDAVAATVANAPAQAETARVWLVIAGGISVLWFSFGLLRALRLVHAAAWDITPAPLRKPHRGLAVVLLAPVILAAMSAAAGWVRENVGTGAGVVTTLAVGAVFGLGWLWVSMRLPAASTHWKHHLPGAVFIGLGFEALHIFTVYFLANSLAQASSLYGSLGLAASLLFFLFWIGRGFVWAAELSAVTREVRIERRQVEAG